MADKGMYSLRIHGRSGSQIYCSKASSLKPDEAVLWRVWSITLRILWLKTRSYWSRTAFSLRGTLFKVGVLGMLISLILLVSSALYSRTNSFDCVDESEVFTTLCIALLSIAVVVAVVQEGLPRLSSSLPTRSKEVELLAGLASVIGWIKVCLHRFGKFTHTTTSTGSFVYGIEIVGCILLYFSATLITLGRVSWDSNYPFIRRRNIQKHLLEEDSCHSFHSPKEEKTQWQEDEDFNEKRSLRLKLLELCHFGGFLFANVGFWFEMADDADCILLLRFLIVWTPFHINAYISEMLKSPRSRIVAMFLSFAFGYLIWSIPVFYFFAKSPTERFIAMVLSFHSGLYVLFSHLHSGMYCYSHWSALTGMGILFLFITGVFLLAGFLAKEDYTSNNPDIHLDQQHRHNAPSTHSPQFFSRNLCRDHPPNRYVQFGYIIFCLMSALLLLLRCFNIL